MVTSFAVIVKVYMLLNVKKLVYVLIMRNVLCYLTCVLPLTVPHARSQQVYFLPPSPQKNLYGLSCGTETKISVSQLAILHV